MEETKKVLEKQLQLLSEQTAQAKDSGEVARLSQAMIEMTYVVQNVCNQIQEANKPDRRFSEWRTVDRRFNILLLGQLIQALTIIIHIVFGH